MFDSYNPYNNLAYGTPYQPVYKNQSPVWQGTRFVSGLPEAQSISTPPGTKTLFMDSQEDKFYIKENDFNGVSTVSQYRFSKIEEQRQDDYITRDEFERWKEAYESAIRQPAAQPATASVGTSASVPEIHEADAAAGASPSAGISQDKLRFG